MSSRRAAGVRAWVLQRVSAVYLALYTLFLITWFLYDPPESHAAWQAWMDSPFTTVSLLLYCFAILLHAWVGMRDVVIDYVHPLMIRVVVLALFGSALVGSGLWVLKVVILAGRGG
jgi:succinate dehydrogenase / fumarate reductase membrane anchor subunit